MLGRTSPSSSSNLSSSDESKNKKIPSKELLKRHRSSDNESVSDMSEKNDDSTSDDSRKKSANAKKVVSKPISSQEKIFSKIEIGLKNTLNFLNEALSPKTHNEIEETTISDISLLAKKYSKLAYWGQRPNEASFVSKLYRKGFKDAENNHFLGIKIDVSLNSNSASNPDYNRKQWTNLQKSYNVIGDISNTTWHLSHAVANSLHGAETGLNIAIATRGNKGFIGQGEAQGYIEDAIRNIESLDTPNSFDMRLKVTDYCDKQNFLVSRRLKIYGIDTHDKKTQATYPEVMLGEFYTDAKLVAMRKGVYDTELKAQVKKFETTSQDYIDILSDNHVTSDRTVDFWQKKKFPARERPFANLDISALKTDNLTVIDRNAPDANTEASVKILHLSKKTRTNDALNPISLLSPNTPEDPRETLSDVMKKAYSSLGEEQKQEVDNRLSDISKMIMAFRDQEERKERLNLEVKIFKKIYDFMKDLKQENIIPANKIREFIPQEVCFSEDKEKTIIEFKKTDISEFVVAILRMKD